MKASLTVAHTPDTCNVTNYCIHARGDVTNLLYYSRPVKITVSWFVFVSIIVVRVVKFVFGT